MATLCVRGRVVEDIDYKALVAGANALSALEIDARGQGYLNSYPIYLEYFQSTEIKSTNDFSIRAGLVYSWMPRVLVLCEDDIGEAVEQMSECFDDQSIYKVIGNVAKALNGSYIGASKLLHFQHPETFPFYDTRVYKNINGLKKKKMNVYQQANKAKCYEAYRNSVQSVILHDGFNKDVYDKVNVFMKGYGYHVSAVRAVEFVVFSNYEINIA
jgi:hypothetical protein